MYLLYADGLKLFRRIDSRDDAVKLQSDLDNLQKWCRNNHLSLNINKCCTITFCKARNTIKNIYEIDKVSLKIIDEIKDLGVVFDTRLTFKGHYYSLFKKAINMWGFIWRHCYMLSP